MDQADVCTISVKLLRSNNTIITATSTNLESSKILNQKMQSPDFQLALSISLAMMLMMIANTGMRKKQYSYIYIDFASQPYPAIF